MAYFGTYIISYVNNEFVNLILVQRHREAMLLGRVTNLDTEFNSVSYNEITFYQIRIKKSSICINFLRLSFADEEWPIRASSFYNFIRYWCGYT